MAADKMI